MWRVGTRCAGWGAPFNCLIQKNAFCNPGVSGQSYVLSQKPYLVVKYFRVAQLTPMIVQRRNSGCYICKESWTCGNFRWKSNRLSNPKCNSTTILSLEAREMHCKKHRRSWIEEGLSNDSPCAIVVECGEWRLNLECLQWPELAI